MSDPPKLAIYLLIALILSSCRNLVTPQPVRLRLAGSTSMQPLMHELAEAYTKRYPHVTIDIAGGGTAWGIKAVRNGSVDIGLASRELSEEEEATLRAAIIARDGIAILVNAQNMLDSLSLRRLKMIFGGEIFDWSEVGGEPGEIVVVSREDGSGTRHVFEEKVMAGERVTPTAIVVPTSDAVYQFVVNTPQAIGYISMGSLSAEVKALVIDGLEPSPEAVRQGKYPLIRPFLLLTKPNPSEEVKAFIGFVLSPAGQAIVGKRYARVR